MVVERLLGWVGLQRRDVMRETDPRWIPLVDPTTYGGAVSPLMAERIAAVHACVDVISSALAALPPIVRPLDAPNPLEALLRRPNAHQTWPDFVQWYISQALLYGNALAVPEDGQLTPIPWPSVRMVDDGSGLQYEVQQPTVDRGYSQQRLVRDVLHMRDRSDDGIVGRSRLQRAGAAVLHAQLLSDAAAAVYANGVTPSGAITVEGRLSPTQRSALREELRAEYAGAANAAKVLLLDQAAKWQGMDATARDSELLESRRFSVVEICRLYEVPPPLVQAYEHNTFTNASTAGQWFSRFTLGGWAAKFSAVFSELLPAGMTLELDMATFQRADLGERWNAYQIALSAGVLGPDEVKAMEGW